MPGAVNGQLDLSEWDFGSYGPVKLCGEWEFYWGKLLNAGDIAMKKIDVLSGRERVRCMLSRMMLSQSNVLMLDEPTNHLDLESITALNDSLLKFQEVILFTSHDHEFVNTVVNRIIEITPGGVIDRLMTFDEYIESTEVAQTREALIRKAA